MKNSRSIGATQGRVKKKYSLKKSDITNWGMLQYMVIKKFKPCVKAARQSSLVVLLILISYKNQAKVKIASKAAISWWGVQQKVLKKSATMR